MERGCWGQTISSRSAIPLPSLLATQVFNECQPDGAKLMGESRWVEAREPGFPRRCECALESSKVDRLAVRTEFPFIDIGEDELTSGGGAASDALQSGEIRLAGQVLRNTQPGEERRLRPAEGRAR
jgi:hypothetical protein